MITAITEASSGVLASRELVVNEHMTAAFSDGFDAAQRRQLADGSLHETPLTKP